MAAEPSSTFERYSEGLKLIGAGRVNEAEAAFYDVIARHLSAEKMSPEEKGQAAESYFQAATIANSMGEVAAAAALFRRALALGCERVEAALGFSSALMHCNRHEEAEAALDKVAEESGAAWQRGQIALKRKDFAGAEKFFRAALAAKKNRTKILIDLSLALEGQGKIRETFKAVTDAVKEDPGLYDFYIEAADRAFALDQEGLAVWHLARAEKTVPREALAWFLLGVRYYGVGALAEAERTYLNSLNLGASLNAYRDLATLMEQSNRLKQAANIARAGLRHGPADGALRTVLAECRARQGGPEEALAMFREVAATAEIANVKGKAELAAGKILDGLGRFDEAFAAFNKGKDLQKTSPEFTEFDFKVSEAHLQESLKIAEASLRPPKVAKAAGEPRQLVFFVGFPRSGTTLLQEVMQSHPDIAVAEEKAILPAALIMLRKFTPELTKGLSELTAETAALLREIYFLQASALASWGGKKVFVDKMPLNLVYLPAIRALFPDAKIILGLRHPCSVALSCLMQDFKLNNFMINMMSLESTTGFYKGVMDIWQATEKAGPFDHLTVKYEDVVADLEKDARRLTEFLGLPFAPEMLAYAEGAKAKGLIRTPSYSQVVKPIYQDALERWKNYRAHIEPFMARLRPYIKAFGYSE